MSSPRVLVPRAAWRPDRWPQWAVDALRAAGADVAEDARRRCDLALVPGSAPPRARRVRARRVVGLLESAPLPGHVPFDGPCLAASAALARGVMPVVRPAAPAGDPGTESRHDGALRVVSAAPLHWSAAHAHVVVAAATLVATGKRVDLCVAGDGPLREEVLFTAFDLGIEVEVVPAARRREAVRGADVFVLAATEDAVWPGLLDALACGVGVVATDLPTVRELAGDGALLVPPRSPADLARAIASLIDDEDRRRELAASARERASTDLEACGRGLLAA